MPEGSEEDWIPSLPTIPAVDTDAIYEKLDQELLKKRLEPRLEPFLPQIPEKEPFNDDEDFTTRPKMGSMRMGSIQSWTLSMGRAKTILLIFLHSTYLLEDPY